MNNKLKIGIIIGGKSVEHDISILSGLQVYHALNKDKYEPTIFYLTKENIWLTGKILEDLITYKNSNFNKCSQIYFYQKKGKVHYQTVNKKGKSKEIDVFIPVLHGDGTEDGTISAFLDLLNVPYTSSCLTSSSIAQDKIYTKQILQAENIPTLPFVKMTCDTYYPEILKEISEKINYPVIIKPARLGSSIGITTANSEDTLRKGIEEGLKFGPRLLIEPKLTDFKEYNLALYKEGNNIKYSCIEEVKKFDEILSFTDKYERIDKLDDSSNRIIPAIISDKMEQYIKDICTKAYYVLDMKGVVRIDCILDVTTNNIYINEINTIPGSFAFYLFDKAGISFPKLIDIAIKQAILSKQANAQYLKVFTSSVLSKTGTKLSK